jgi:DNA-binding CsgD family transcriptional regulator
MYRELVEASDTPARSALLLEFGLTARYAMQNGLAQRTFKEAREISAAAGDAAGASRAARMLAGIELERPDPRRAEQYLEPPASDASTRELCRYESLCAAVAAMRGDTESARDASARSLEHARHDETRQELAYAHGAAAMVFTALGLAEGAVEHHRAALAILRDTDAVGVDIMTRLRLAYALFLCGRLEEAHAVVSDCPAPDDLAIARVSELTAALPVAALRGDDDLARRVYDPSIVEAAFDSAELTRVGPLLLGMTLYAERRGETEVLAPLFERALCLADCAYGSEPALAFAALYTRGEVRDRAHRLLAQSKSPAGAACFELFQAYAAADDAARGRHALCAAELFSALPWPYFAGRAYELAGQKNTASELYGRIGARAEHGRLWGGARSAELSKRERQIAELVAQGLTSREIAARLSLSTRTVDNHLASVYRKLGVRTRAELAARVLRAEAK